MFYLLTLLVSLGAGLLTWYLNCRRQWGAVLSSAVVTLTAGLLLPSLSAHGGALAPMAACASYIGMSADTCLGRLWQIVAALFVAALYVLSVDTFAGVGGKGGTIAAICVMAVWGGTQLAIRSRSKTN